MLYQKIMLTTHPVVSGLLFLFWLLMFPNAPYMITDVIHVSPILFYDFTENGTIYIQNIMAWMQLIQLVTGILIGFFAGMESMVIMMNQIAKRYGQRGKLTAFVCICLFSGYGVFLGRFLRLNSWDILHPGSLFMKVVQETNVFAIQFSFCFALFIAFSYCLLNLVKNHK